MARPPFPGNFRLAAIDVDGTLVGSTLEVSEANRRGLQRLQAAGIEIVLASGRHYETLRPFADAVPGIRWLVAAQGGDVVAVDRSQILRQAFLDQAGGSAVVALGRSLGFHVALYSEDGILVDDDAAVLGFYTRIAGRRPRHTAREWTTQRLLKVVWIGEPDAIAAVPGRAEIAAFDMEKVRTHQQLFEFSPRHVSKASGLAVLVDHLGLKADQVVAFGDADNDVPMFTWAGMSVAMDHGWPAAKAHASMVTPAGPAETALARAIDGVFSGSKIEPSKTCSVEAPGALASTGVSASGTSPFSSHHHERVGNRSGRNEN